MVKCSEGEIVARSASPGLRTSGTGTTVTIIARIVTAVVQSVVQAIAMAAAFETSPLPRVLSSRRTTASADPCHAARAVPHKTAKQRKKTPKDTSVFGAELSSPSRIKSAERTAEAIA